MRLLDTYKKNARPVCITNNPLWNGETETLRRIDGTSMDVFLAARDLIHLGWRFAAHPLYGNFNPLRHPYRTLVLLEPIGEGRIDMESITLLEKALETCRNSEKNSGAAKELPESMKGDYALLDRELSAEVVTRFIGRGGNL